MGRTRLLIIGVCLAASVVARGAAPIPVMILDGEAGGPYHDWQRVTPALEKMLEETGLFTVAIVTAPTASGDFPGFAPDFMK